MSSSCYCGVWASFMKTWDCDMIALLCVCSFLDFSGCKFYAVKWTKMNYLKRWKKKIDFKDLTQDIFFKKQFKLKLKLLEKSKKKISMIQGTSRKFLNLRIRTFCKFMKYFSVFDNLLNLKHFVKLHLEKIT